MIYEYKNNETLNPSIWDGGEFPDKLRAGLLKIAQEFYRFLKIEVKIKDITLTGSNVNYNWTEYSDLDVHVVIDYSAVDENNILVTNYFLAKKSIWNRQYPLKYKGMDIELYAEDINDTRASDAAIYSLLRNKWVNEPSKETINIPDQDIENKAKPFKYEIDQLDPNDPSVLNKINQLKTKLRKFRKTGLQDEGEYSVENLAFKELRNSGYLQKLANIKQNATMDQLQINELSNEYSTIIEYIQRHLYSDNKMDSNEWKYVIQNLNGIVHPMGQWKYPGKCTLIPSNKITMENVTYPVFGFDNTGHSEYMMPNKTYDFPGKVVFEIPDCSEEYNNLINRIRTNEME